MRYTHEEIARYLALLSRQQVSADKLHEIRLILVDYREQLRLLDEAQAK